MKPAVPWSMVAVLWGTVACAEQETAREEAATPDDVKSAIEQRLEPLGEATAGGWSAEVAAAFFTQDAKLLPPGRPVVTGPAGVADFWTEFAAESGLARIRTTTHEAVETGEGYVAERGAYVMYGADGAEMASGKYLTLWAEEDGEWKLHWDAWNVDPSPQ